ncbi:putative protein FAM220BP [Otolemur garnettii]|uniref:putative protein FAM220BP n=1 Tax=Otolemur garnettii TaxID=30611 RepID=UPI0006444040|nr:putative protein FAM220BP [Otolemur garnettii]
MATGEVSGSSYRLLLRLTAAPLRHSGTSDLTRQLAPPAGEPYLTETVGSRHLWGATSPASLYSQSIRRNSDSAATPSKAMGLFSVPAEEHFPGVSWSVVEALGRDWLGRGPRAMGSHRGQCSKGEFGVSGLPCHQELLGMEIYKDDPPSAFPEVLGSELEPSCLHSVLSAVPHTCPEVLLNDETKHIFLEHLKPMFSKQTIEYKKMLSSVESTSIGLQITWGLLAL